MVVSSSNSWLFSDLFYDDDSDNHNDNSKGTDCDIYSETGMSERLDDDAITSKEEGFMQGYLTA